MAISKEEKAHLKERAWEEFLTYVALTVYLALLTGGFLRYRQLILAEYGIHYARYGYGILEAMILAKLVMIGEALHLGRRLLGNAPRIVIVLCKTAIFSLFVMVFTVGEHYLRGLIEHKSMSQIFDALIAGGKDEIMAQILLMVVAFVPMFALIELSQALGEKDFYRLWLQRPSQPENRAQVDR